MSVLNPILNARAFWNYLRIIFRKRELTWELTKREFAERYAGQFLGALWGVAHPLIIILVYVFIFTFVFQARLDRPGAGLTQDYTVYILCGLIPWMALAETLSKGTQVILTNSNLVKQIIFPIEVLPAKTVLNTFLTEIILFGLLLVYSICRSGTLSPAVALLPVLLGLHLLQMMGIALFLATLGPYFRDLKEIMQVFCLVNIYMVPVFYLPNWVPEAFRPILYLNPFSYQTWCFQDVLFFGHIAHPWAWVVFPLLSVISLALGYRTFNKLKPFFGNVL